MPPPPTNHIAWAHVGESGAEQALIRQVCWLAGSLVVACGACSLISPHHLVGAAQDLRRYSWKLRASSRYHVSWTRTTIWMILSEPAGLLC